MSIGPHSSTLIWVWHRTMFTMGMELVFLVLKKKIYPTQPNKTLSSSSCCPAWDITSKSKLLQSSITYDTFNHPCYMPYGLNIIFSVLFNSMTPLLVRDNFSIQKTSETLCLNSWFGIKSMLASTLILGITHASNLL